MARFQIIPIILNVKSTLTDSNITFFRVKIIYIADVSILGLDYLLSFIITNKKAPDAF